MEELNPWLDPNAGKHKNKKSTKPPPDFKNFPVLPPLKQEVIVEVQPKIEVKIQSSDKLVPGILKTNNLRVLDFFTTLVNDSLDVNLPPSVSQWAIENFDEKWLREFLEDIQDLQEDILTSKYFPSAEQMLLLKFIFLLRQA